jgi:hypothetical protein
LSTSFLKENTSQSGKQTKSLARGKVLFHYVFFFAPQAKVSPDKFSQWALTEFRIAAYYRSLLTVGINTYIIESSN